MGGGKLTLGLRRGGATVCCTGMHGVDDGAVDGGVVTARHSQRRPNPQQKLGEYGFSVVELKNKEAHGHRVTRQQTRRLLHKNLNKLQQTEQS